VAQTPMLHLSAPGAGISDPAWQRLIDSVEPGSRLEVEGGGCTYYAVRVHDIAVACAVDDDEALERVDRWIDHLLAAADPD